jgi:hypothetical protein
MEGLLEAVIEEVRIMRSDLTAVQNTVASLKGVCEVNQELVKHNIHLNGVCNEQTIPELPPIQMQTKLRVKIEAWGADEVLLTGSTFDVKEDLKKLFQVKFVNAMDKKGWAMQRSRVPDLLASSLTDICEFDSSCI